MEGTEEFFEALRAARRERPHPEPAPGAEEGAEPAAEQAAPPPEPDAGGAPSQQQPIPPATHRRFPVSVFADNEPTITLRRSTVIFAIIAVAILLFISYALGKRAGSPSHPQNRERSQTGGLNEIRRPALPPELRNKLAIYMKEFDQTQDAGAANARAYRDFLNRSADAAFIRSAAKQAFIVSSGRKLILCVGPFDSLRGADINVLLPRLRELSYNGVQHFGGVNARLLPDDARLFD